MNIKATKKHSSISNGNSNASLTEHKIHIGPLPSAEELQKYESIHQGFAERLLAMAEKEQDNRIKDKTQLILNANVESKGIISVLKRGQFFAVLCVIILTSLCFFLAHLGDTKSAATVATVAIIGVVSLFITGKFNNNNKNTNSLVD